MKHNVKSLKVFILTLGIEKIIPYNCTCDQENL